MSRKPWLWLLAGPNGAGKSTYAPKFENIPVINTDEIARKLSPSAPERAAFAAGRRSIALMRRYLRRKKSFAVETTLSGQLHIDAAEKASAEGWRVGLVYIGLASSRLAIERVRQRQPAEGHGVPAADVHRRYERSLRQLPC